MHAWKRVFALLATVTISNGLPASYAADVFPEFDYVATCKTDQPDSAGTGETLAASEAATRPSVVPIRTRRKDAVQKQISTARLLTSSCRSAFRSRLMYAPVFATAEAT
jgi:hypothetical protein